MHSLAPLCAMNVPSGHASHTDAPVAALKRPGVHSALKPLAHAEPTGQLTHAVPLLANVPPGQTVQVDRVAPSLHTLPGPATHVPEHDDDVI